MKTIYFAKGDLVQLKRYFTGRKKDDLWGRMCTIERVLEMDGFYEPFRVIAAITVPRKTLPKHHHPQLLLLVDRNNKLVESLSGGNYISGMYLEKIKPEKKRRGKCRVRTM